MSIAQDVIVGLGCRTRGAEFCQNEDNRLRRLDGPFRLKELHEILTDGAYDNYTTDNGKTVWYMRVDFDRRTIHGTSGIAFYVDVIHDENQDTLDLLFADNSKMTDDFADALAFYFGGRLESAKG